MTPSTTTRCLQALSLMQKDQQQQLKGMKSLWPSNPVISQMVVELEATQNAIEELQTRELAR